MKPDGWCAKWKDAAFVPLAEGQASKASDDLVLKVLADLGQGATQAKLIRAVMAEASLSRNAVDHRLKKMLVSGAIEAHVWRGMPRTMWAHGEWEKRDAEPGDDAPIEAEDMIDYWAQHRLRLKSVFADGCDVARRQDLAKALGLDKSHFLSFLRRMDRMGNLRNIGRGDYEITPKGRAAWAKERARWAAHWAEKGLPDPEGEFVPLGQSPETTPELP